MQQLITPALALLGFLCFSISDGLIRTVSAQLPFMTITFYICIVGLACLTANMAMTGRLHLLQSGDNLIWHGLRSVMNIIKMPTLFYIFANLPMAQAYTGIVISPIVVAIAAWIFLGERLKSLEMGLVILGFVGVFISMSPEGQPLSLAHGAVALLVLLITADAIIMRKMGSSTPVDVAAFWPVAAAMVFTALIEREELMNISVSAMMVCAIAGIVSVIGLLALVAAYARGPLVAAVQMQYSQIIWGAIIGYLFWHEAPDAQIWIGGVLVALAGGILVWRQGRSGVAQEKHSHAVALVTANPVAQDL